VDDFFFKPYVPSADASAQGQEPPKTSTPQSPASTSARKSGRRAALLGGAKR
jgi:hypothetical protein